jgi:hypothetical protein
MKFLDRILQHGIFFKFSTGKVKTPDMIKRTDAIDDLVKKHDKDLTAKLDKVFGITRKE